MSIIDQCPQHPICKGRLRIVSIDRNERMRRRIGSSLVGKCVKCGQETLLVKSAWMKFAKELRLVKKASRQADRDNQQPSLF